MFKKAIIATATAAVIAAASLATMTTSASATSYKTNYGGHYTTKVVYVPKKYCEPVYKQVQWQDYYGQWHWKTVQTGTSCKTVYVKDYQKIWVPAVYWKPQHNWKAQYGWKPQYGWKAY